MIFSSYAPSPALRDIARDYLVAHFRFPPGTPIPHKRYAPKPEQGLTFFVRGRPSIVNPRTGSAQIAPPVAVFGQQIAPCDVCLAPEFLMLRVHFQPGVLFRMLRIPLNEFGDEYCDAEPLLGRAMRGVSEQVASARSYREMIGVIEAYLGSMVDQIRTTHRRVDAAIMHLAADPVHVSLDWLAREACLSPRQFNRTFIDRVGVGPKLYQRLSRFHGAYLFKQTHPAIAWPAIAIEFGYTDYQHMVRDFRQFTEATPNVWLEVDRRSPEYALLDFSRQQLED